MDHAARVALTEEDQPRLWALARELAELAGCRCPDEIGLVAGADATVSDAGGRLGLRRRTRLLDVGAALLIGTDEDQFRSVLAHALGPVTTASAAAEPLATAWREYVATFASMGVGLGRRPRGLLTGFAWHLGSGRGGATALLASPEELFTALEDRLYADSGLLATPLTELAPLEAAVQLAGRAAAFDRVLLEQGRNAGLATVYQTLGNGTAAGLLRRQLPEDETDLSRYTARVLADYLGAALVDADAASLAIDWSSGWAVVDPTGVPLELRTLVDEVLAKPSLAGDLHELMRRSGVPDTWRPPEVPDDPAPACA
jgi:hypothetical protein